jgi:hypothetical protein
MKRLLIPLALVVALATGSGVGLALDSGAQDPVGASVPAPDSFYEGPGAGDGAAVHPTPPREWPPTNDGKDTTVSVSIGDSPGDVQPGYEVPFVVGICGNGDGPLPLAPTKAPEPDPATVAVPAPIDRVGVQVMESYPPQYNLVVASGLPNSCVSFGGYSLSREGFVIKVEVTNFEPATLVTPCDEVYGLVETAIPLGSDVVPGETYTVVVNDVTTTFVAQ